MAQTFSNKLSDMINAPITDVWQALTDPSMIGKYFFNVKVNGDWKEGNTIVYQGEWQGKKFQSKAKVLQVREQKLLKYSYWSDMSGNADLPENYHIITYELKPMDGKTELTMTEENLADEKMKEKSAMLWKQVFENLRNLLEKKPVAQSIRNG
jgi:uncharacterized protein YndB with AHSA1/START domain